MELVIAIAISAVILVGIGAALRVILVSSADSTNKALARIEVQYADSWIGDDVVQAQSVSMGSSSNGWGGFPLNISWTTPQPGNITYSIQPITDKLGRNLWSLCRTTNSGTATVAEYLNPLLTSCSLGFGTFGNVLVLNVASEVDTYSASASYTITPRAGNVTWTVVGISPYTLSYTAGGNGTLTGQTSQIVNYGGSGTPVTAVGVPANEYHFVNWSDSSTANPRTDTNVTGNISVSASFAINTYTLTYNGNGATSGTAPSDASSPYNYNATVTVLGNTGSLAKTGCTFSGWNTAANGSGTAYAPGATFNITANTTLYAQWTCTVTYNGNGATSGTAPSDASSPYNYNATVTVLGNTGSLAKTGYTFAGWNTAANGSGTAYAPGATFSITANTTLYAKWTINSYTLTYAAGPHGSISGDTSQTVSYGGSGTAVTAVPDIAHGYYFVDWNDGLTANPRTDTNVTVNISVKANFSK